MRFLSTASTAVLAAVLLAAGVPEARADGTGAVTRPPAASAPGEQRVSVAAPQEGTEEEERAYARREAESPEVQQFSGGFIIALLTIVVLVLLIVFLVQKV